MSTFGTPNIDGVQTAGIDQPLVEGLDHRVMASSDQSSHVESSSDLATSTTHRSLASEPAAIASERRYADQGGDLSAVQSS